MNLGLQMPKAQIDKTLTTTANGPATAQKERRPKPPTQNHREAV